MRRPIRTRRLSIAAMMSLLAFVVVVGAGVRSIWTWELVAFGTRHGIAIEEARVVYLRTTGGQTGHFSGSIHAENPAIPWGFSGFYAEKTAIPPDAPIDARIFVLAVPLGPLLLLLLIAPIRWLIARPANAPAFPVVADAKLSE